MPSGGSTHYSGYKIRKRMQQDISNLSTSHHSIHSTSNSTLAFNMIKLLLLSAMCGLAMAGHAQQSQGHGWQQPQQHGWQQPQQHGWQASNQGHGHGWHRPYHGWANVNVWQNPHGYQFGLNEQGSGYNKYVWQGADFQHSHQVQTGHGWQG